MGTLTILGVIHVDQGGISGKVKRCTTGSRWDGGGRRRRYGGDDGKEGEGEAGGG